MRNVCLFAVAGVLACAEGTHEQQSAAAPESVDAAVQDIFAYRACDFAPPGALVPLRRTVAGDRDPAAGAIGEVVRGVTDTERDRGCSSFFSSRTENALLSLRRSSAGDTVFVDFRDFADSLPDASGVRSFLPPGVMAELTWTLFDQFPGIQAVRFLFNGDEQAFWEWLGGRGTDAEVFTRSMWEQI